jgi:hypothetical protein
LAEEAVGVPIQGRVGLMADGRSRVGVRLHEAVHGDDRAS